ncbi:TIGR01459 family HAD-type hydrolase [Pararhizobium mangrovi]|uniref:TIGR01459 family HAD-type hydrolase n=1 Tax=Pararhizobium mangrovi TaxID=2590452 RepID=A0A506TX67_9HYPH|nr:TIGR01459 family HAD-type hydrolase [Pararhizobium mangrovi]TPW26632.1 TIGR01459 family HAD-type hydrolase [Pararhizobium mangrovi]
MPKRLHRLSEASANYDVILSDVWGVVHNGVRAYGPACEALAETRRAGTTVVLITNSPRRVEPVHAQLRQIGVPDEAFDRLVTSGDVTRHLIAEGPHKLFFIGAERDHHLFEGLDVSLVGEDEAEGVLCTGPFDDENEGAEDYRAMLTRFRERDLPFICANPDLVVERGERLVTCAGALTKLYGELGGRTLIAGKPYRPIYEEAMATARDVRDAVDPAGVLAIGDGLATDVKGAQDFGLDVLFVAAGIHAREYGGNDIDADRLSAYLDAEGAAPRYWMPRLV